MKTIKLFSGLSIVITIALVSCNKNDISPSMASARFKIQATSKIQPVSRDLSVDASSALANNSFVWDTALLVVSKIEMEAEREHGKESGIAGNVITARNGESGSEGNGHSGNDNSGTMESKTENNSDSASFEWRGPKTIDLFNLNSVIGDVTLVPGTFSNLSIKIKSFKSDSPNSPLFDLTGDYTNSAGIVKRTKIIINEDFELRINKADTLDFSKDFTSIIKMNLSLVMTGISQAGLDNAVLTNGNLIISSTVNVNLYNIIKKNLHESGESEFERD